MLYGTYPGLDSLAHTVCGMCMGGNGQTQGNQGSNQTNTNNSSTNTNAQGDR